VAGGADRTWRAADLNQRRRPPGGGSPRRLAPNLRRPSAGGEEPAPAPRDAAEEAAAEAFAAEAPVGPTGDPLILGLPSFLVGAVALALVQINFAPAAAVGAAIPIIATATFIGLLIATIWAARLAQNAVAGVLWVFTGFWVSYAAVVIGLGHRWWAILPAGVARSVEVFLIAWIVVLGLLTLGTLRLPVAYTALLVLVDAVLVFVLLATIQGSVNLTKTAGWILMGAAVVGAYLYGSTLSTATGGRAWPMGPPLIR
jgi:succinate-acetate transporter protein